MSLEPNTLYYGDCLDWMRRWDDASVDLIYLDPPFNSKTDYNVLYAADGAGDAQYRAFSDTWSWDDAAADRHDLYDRAVAREARDTIKGLYRMLGDSGMMAYLTYMAERLEECKRILKPTGSIYLHCDPTASHYLKTVMDGIFGAANFRNEVTWKRFNFHADAKRFGAISDRILFYSRNVSDYRFNRVRMPYSKEYVRSKFTHRDHRGRYRLSDLNPPAGRGPVYAFNGVTKPWRITEAKMRQLDAEGRIYKESKIAQIKRYLHEAPGQAVGDIWIDITGINSQAKERLGYATQKPLKLLERIIEASSQPGDIVLDPFCGCGTAIEAAHKLNRRWAGIDISSFAIDLIRDKRLPDVSIPAQGIPYDLASAMKLARDNPFNFESWAVMRLPGFAPNTRQVADGGVDGRATLAYQPDDHPSRLALAQVKGGKFNLSALRDFTGVTDSRRAALGCYITLKPVSTPAARRVVLGAGKVTVSGYRYPRMQLWPISDFFDNRPPRLPVMNDPYNGKPLEQVEMFR